MGPKMCINPSFIWVQRGPTWEQQPVACRQCWRCMKNRVNDYVGRCMAEAATSDRVCALTLTYAPRQDLADKVLHPRHFQLFVKLLRRRGHVLRYLVAGEYGAMRGRAHFHALLFFRRGENSPSGAVPWWNPHHLDNPDSSARFSFQIPQQRNVHVAEWPHGHIFADWSANERTVRYVCKYLLHGDKNNAWFSVSKKPPLGAEWFAAKAASAVRLGVLPSSFEYLPPGCDREKPYLMTGATRRDYLNAICTDPASRSLMSEWVRKTFDKYERKRIEAMYAALPLDAQLAAMLDMRAVRDEQFAFARMCRNARDAGELEARLLDSDTGRLRRLRGEWVDEN